MTHLGERLSALIDGELGHNERDRVLAHLAGCDPCRAEADGLRALKGRLRALSDEPAVPADLTMALLRMSEPGEPLPPRTRPLGPRPSGRTVAARRAAAPYDNRPGRGPARGGPGIIRSRRVRYTAVGVVSAAVALGTLFWVGGWEAIPSINPPLETYVQHHKDNVRDAPFSDPGGRPSP